jgi:hypothetical protein
LAGTIPGTRAPKNAWPWPGNRCWLHHHGPMDLGVRSTSVAVAGSVRQPTCRAHQREYANCQTSPSTWHSTCRTSTAGDTPLLTKEITPRLQNFRLDGSVYHVDEHASPRRVRCPSPKSRTIAGPQWPNAEPALHQITVIFSSSEKGAVKVDPLIDFQGRVARIVALVSVVCTMIVGPGPNAASAATLGEMRLLIPSTTDPALRLGAAVSVVQTAAGARCRGQIVGWIIQVPAYIGPATADSDGRVTLKGDAPDHWTFGWPGGLSGVWVGPGRRVLTVTCVLDGNSVTQEFRFDVL